MAVLLINADIKLDILLSDAEMAHTGGPIPVTGSQLYELFYGRESLNCKLFMLINHASLPFLDAVMPAFTFLSGSKIFPYYCALLLALFLIDRRLMPGRYLFVFLVASFISLGVESFLKEFFHVPRPPFALGAGNVRILGKVSSSYSLPSGHAVFSFMTAFTLTYGRGLSCKILIFFWALLVGYSRIYLGDHYPFDVLAGALVGVTIGLTAWKCFASIEVWYGRLKRKRGAV